MKLWQSWLAQHPAFHALLFEGILPLLTLLALFLSIVK